MEMFDHRGLVKKKKKKTVENCRNRYFPKLWNSLQIVLDSDKLSDMPYSAADSKFFV